MNIRRKTPAELEANVSGYLLDRGNPNLRREHLAHLVGTLLTQSPDEIAADFDLRAMHTVPSEFPFEVDELQAEYLTYLRARGTDPTHHETRVRAIEQYDRTFRPHIDGRQFSEHLDSGTFSRVYPLTVDGVGYIVRRAYEHDLDQTGKHLDASLRVRDLDHVEHVQAVSFRDGITIAPRVPGQTLRRLSLQDLQAITDDQLQALYKTMQRAAERGVCFDADGGNFLYDPDAGFCAIDLGTTTNDSDANTPLLETFYQIASLWPAQSLESSEYASELLSLLQRVYELVDTTTLPEYMIAKVEDLLRELPQQIQRYRQYEQAVAAHEAAKNTKHV